MENRFGKGAAVILLSGALLTANALWSKATTIAEKSKAKPHVARYDVSASPRMSPAAKTPAKAR